MSEFAVSFPGTTVYPRPDPTPAEDLRGQNATATVPYLNLRPSETEDAGTITARTSVIQRAIDEVSLNGGGQVVIPPGLYQCNQIIIKDRVALIGAGKSKTVLVAAALASGEAFIKSYDYDARLADYELDPNGPTGSVKYLHGGALTNIEIRNMTIDGNGYSLGAQPASSWDIAAGVLTEDNLGGDNDGIALFASGAYIDQVRIYACSGNGLTLYRGHEYPGVDDTSADNTMHHINELEVVYCGGHGVYIGQHADGIIKRLKVWFCETVGKAGLYMDGGSWHIMNLHAYVCHIGCYNNNANYFGTLQAESCNTCGWINAEPAGDQTSDNTTVEHLIAFGNGRSPETGTNSGTSDTVLTDLNATWVADQFIGWTILNTTDGSHGTITDNDGTTITVGSLSGGTADTWVADDAYEISQIPSVQLDGSAFITNCTMKMTLYNNITGFKINSGAGNTRISGRIDIAASPVLEGIRCVDMNTTGDLRTRLNLSGWMNDAIDSAYMVFRGAAKGNEITLHVGGCGGTTGGASSHYTLPGTSNWVLLPVQNDDLEVAVPWWVSDSNRVRVFYDSFTVAETEAYPGKLTGTHKTGANSASLVESASTWLADELIGGRVTNTTDFSSGYISDNDTTTVTAVMSGGTESDWDVGEAFTIDLPQVELIPY